MQWGNSDTTVGRSGRGGRAASGGGGGGGGGYFKETNSTPGGRSKPFFRPQFLCPLTVRQALSAPEDGFQLGDFTATMVYVTGVVVKIETTPTKFKFRLADDTGVIECIEWIDLEYEPVIIRCTSVQPGSYYQIFGCIKLVMAERKIMVFKVVPLKRFNEYTAFMAEILAVKGYAAKKKKEEEMEQMMDMPIKEKQPAKISPPLLKTVIPNRKPKNSFTALHTSILQEVRAQSELPGWSKLTSKLNKTYSKREIEEALEVLVGEGHIFATIDDCHYTMT